MKKKYLVLFLLMIMIFTPNVKAGYNGGSGVTVGPSYGNGCTPTKSHNIFKGKEYICAWNLENTKALQITLYYFDGNGNRTQIGNRLYVVNNKNNNFQSSIYAYTESTLATKSFMSGLTIDNNIPVEMGTIGFSSTDLETYFTKDNYKVTNQYLDWMGVNVDNLTKPSEPANKNTAAQMGYRLVIEPMYVYARDKDGQKVLELMTVKELSNSNIVISGSNSTERKKRYNIFSKSLYLEFKDVGISEGISSGVSTSKTEDEMREIISDSNSGWGYNIIDITNKIPQKCEWTTETSCCNDKNNLTGEDLENFKLAHPACFETTPTPGPTEATCDFTLNTSVPNVCSASSSGGYVKDIDNWGCIYESSSSNNTNVKNYFLKYGTTTSACAVYCRDELEYEYPRQGMIALAGNYFTIGNVLNSYHFELVGNEFKITAATLGPVKVTVKRECSITGTADASCNNALQTQLNNLKTSSPTITFTYDSNHYGKVTETLKETKVSEVDSTTPASDGVNEIKSKTVTFEYKLPSNTYRYVSKNIGVSYKNTSDAGKYPVIDIGAHLPLHFSQINDSIDFELNLTKFNLTNFDNLVIKGNKMPTQYITSIESYIKTLIDSGNATPTKIGNIYYLDSSFINLLSAKGYSVSNFLYMDCADTDKYTCYSNANGIFCYDEGTTSNSASTYALFNACIGNTIQNSTKSYKKDLKYTCSFDIDKNIVSEETSIDSETSNGINVIFRPISLDNPFPSIDGDGRITGANWCYGRDCSNTNSVVEEVILNNRDVESEKIYKELDPLYRIVLTPTLIKQIRKYNDTTTYADFNLECDSDGNGCKANFIREKINNKYDFSSYFSGCGIDGKDDGLNCAANDAW